jgi:ABC-type sugar transport system ATPase subunit
MFSYDKIVAARTKLAMATESVKSAEDSLGKSAQLKQDLLAMQAIVQSTAMDVQQQLKYNIESIVNLMMDALFPQMYEFKLVFEVKRNKTECRLVLVEDGNEIDPLDSTGGGLADCLATALRIALLIISNKSKVLILDEIGKFVSADKREDFFEIIKKISKDLDIQIIMVTHDQQAINIADKVIKIVKDNGVSRVS